MLDHRAECQHLIELGGGHVIADKATMQRCACCRNWFYKAEDEANFQIVKRTFFCEDCQPCQPN